MKTYFLQNDNSAITLTTKALLRDLPKLESSLTQLSIKIGYSREEILTAFNKKIEESEEE